jgi:DNA repair protein RadC
MEDKKHRGRFSPITILRGVCEPGQADIRITARLQKALALVDIRVLDHVIVGDGITCLSGRGLV